MIILDDVTWKNSKYRTIIPLLFYYITRTRHFYIILLAFQTVTFSPLDWSGAHFLFGYILWLSFLRISCKNNWFYFHLVISIRVIGHHDYLKRKTSIKVSTLLAMRGHWFLVHRGRYTTLIRPNFSKLTSIFFPFFFADFPSFFFFFLFFTLLLRWYVHHKTTIFSVFPLLWARRINTHIKISLCFLT